MQWKIARSSNCPYKIKSVYNVGFFCSIVHTERKVASLQSSYVSTLFCCTTKYDLFYFTVLRLKSLNYS